MIAMLRQVSNPGKTEGARWAQMRIHRVASATMTDLGSSSKLNAEWEFLTVLRDEGRRSAEELLTAHASNLGARSTSTSTPCSTRSEARWDWPVYSSL